MSSSASSIGCKTGGVQYRMTVQLGCRTLGARGHVGLQAQELRMNTMAVVIGHFCTDSD